MGKRIKTAELEGAELDWVVAVADGYSLSMDPYSFETFTLFYKPSTDWACGGPIIERERIHIEPQRGHEPPVWWALHTNLPHIGHSPLIAAMRAFVASKLGDEVEVPHP